MAKKKTLLLPVFLEPELMEFLNHQSEIQKIPEREIVRRLIHAYKLELKNLKYETRDSRTPNKGL